MTRQAARGARGKGSGLSDGSTGGPVEPWLRPVDVAVIGHPHGGAHSVAGTFLVVHERVNAVRTGRAFWTMVDRCEVNVHVCPRSRGSASIQVKMLLPWGPSGHGHL